LSYTVDGVSVTKTVTSFAFARNDPSGTYRGQLTDGSGNHDPAIITVSDAGGSIALHIQGMYGGTCDYTGPSQQLGAAVYATGNVQCGGGSGGPFTLRDLLVSFNGISGRIDLGNVTGFVQDGLRSFHFAGARENAN
jgi:hypothetical protein